MTVTHVEKDHGARTMTITTEFDAAVDRVWRLWAEPRQLERWWGPPDYPATVVEHDLRRGGKVAYYVTGPDGDRMHGWWDVRAVDPPRQLEFDLGDPNIPTMTVRVRVDERASGGTRMTIETSFPSDEAMAHLLSIGFEEGLSSALGQIDDVLRADEAPH